MSVVHLRLSINDDHHGIWTGLSFDSVQFSGGSPVEIDEHNDSATRRAVSRCPFMRAVRAFSLIELLVVVAIIGVLVGITLPVLSRARRLAFTARELAAGQQIMTAYACYAQENKDAVLPGYLPLSWVSNPPTPGAPEFVVEDEQRERVYGTQAQRYPWRLWPFLSGDFRGLYKDEDLLKNYRSRTDFQYFVSLSPTFGLNSMFVGGDATLDRKGFSASAAQQYGPFYISRIDQAQRPCELLVFASAHGVNPDGGDLVSGFFRIDPPRRATGAEWWVPGSDLSTNPAAGGYVDFRHSHKAAAAFFDGHVNLAGYNQMLDMRLWADRATRPDWSLNTN